MACTRLAPLLLLAASACAASAPALRQTGTLGPGAIITASTATGNISLYAPERGQPDNEFTAEAYGPGAAPVTSIRYNRGRLVVAARRNRADLLLRGPKGSAADLEASNGNINVADFDGVVTATTDRGDIKMLLPQYGQAHAGIGNVSVIFASTTWRGTLYFSSIKGDVELYVNENAEARVHLYAAHGTIFTDFPLKGTAHGSSEEIEGTINGGPSGKSQRAVDVFVRDGSIRLLQLKPQV